MALTIGHSDFWCYHWVSATCGKEALPVDGKLTEGLDVAEAIRCLCTGKFASLKSNFHEFPSSSDCIFRFFLPCVGCDVCPLIWGPLTAEYISWVDDVRPASGRNLVQVPSAVQSTLVSKGSIPKIAWVSQWRYVIWKKCHYVLQTIYIWHMKSRVYILICIYKYKHYRCIFQGRQGLLVRYVYVL